MSKIEDSVNLLLMGLREELGLDLNDKNLFDTPKRIERAYLEILSGLKNTDEQIEKVLSAKFPSKNDNMIIARNIEVFSMCPHHFLPVRYNISLGYIPNKEVLGISKLSRVCEILAKRPVLQEDLTHDIVALIMKINPKGVIAVIRGEHMCMRMRGAKQKDSVIMTNAVKGCFETQSATRAEFLNSIKE